MEHFVCILEALLMRADLSFIIELNTLQETIRLELLFLTRQAQFAQRR